MRSILGISVLALAAAGAPALAQDARTVQTEDGPVTVTVFAEGLDHPWGMAFLPDGRMLVTERAGRLRIVAPNGRLSEPLAGVPEVAARGQGGLLDVAVSPDFASDSRIFLTYAEPGENGTAGTAAASAVLGDSGLSDVQVIFRAMKTDGSGHYGSRLAFAPDGSLFISTGDRQKLTPAQDNSNALGTVIHVDTAGRAASGNAFPDGNGGLAEIWSYGHRNIQSAAIHPQSGKLWLVEMGPRGGDELNIAESGRNYGWPLVSWGDHYNGEDIPNPPTRPDFADAIRQWTPVIAPSGMAFYTGDAFPGWSGNALIGGMKVQSIVRLELEGESVVHEERISLGQRIRDVEQGPDGAIYASTDEDDGEILKLVPAARR